MDRRSLSIVCLWLVAATAIARAADREPGIGPAALAEYARLPELRTYRVVSFSSYDRTGGNGDTGQYLSGRAGPGENLLMDAMGPGCVFRIWFTGHDPEGTFRAYFDGETYPRLSLRMRDLFSGEQWPFLAPFVANNERSSGGFVCYLPLPFRERLRITTTGRGHYYNLACALYPAGAPIESFTRASPPDAGRLLLANEGGNPLPVVGRFQIERGVSLAPGERRTLFALDRGGTITGLHLRAPAIPLVASTPPITDDGRAHRGASEFRVAIDPEAEQVLLVRRLDYGIGNQKARVRVDGEVAGEWFDAGSDAADKWRDSTFALPPALTRGKRSILVRIEFVSSDFDWNEFRYWVRCRRGDQERETDVVDVGQPASEQAHAYRIERASWEGRRDYHYPQPEPTDRADLRHLWIRIFWDGESQPSIEAPLDHFFLSGSGAAPLKSLVAAILAPQFSCYLPMPFFRSARIEVENRGPVAVDDLEFLVSVADPPAKGARVGYLKTQYRAGATTPGRDWIFLAATGQGHLVAVCQNFGPVGGTLEGDERIYVDDSRSPAIYGTGTEDFYNGGWYFDRGRFTLATHGHPVRGRRSSAYRVLFPDVIPFTRSIRAGIEHGPVNDVASHYSTLAFYYHRPEVASEVSDILEVGDAASEQAHDYRATDSENVALTARYEGDDDDVDVHDTGRRTTGAIEFTLRLPPRNAGAVLRRRLDFAIPNQQARVFVDGRPVGTWYTAGSNPHQRWREAEFLLPASVTRGRSRLRLRLEPVDGAVWTDFTYWLLALKEPA